MRAVSQFQPNIGGQGATGGLLAGGAPMMGGLDPSVLAMLMQQQGMGGMMGGGGMPDFQSILSQGLGGLGGSQ